MVYLLWYINDVILHRSDWYMIGICAWYYLCDWYMKYDIWYMIYVVNNENITVNNVVNMIWYMIPSGIFYNIYMILYM